MKAKSLTQTGLLTALLALGLGWQALGETIQYNALPNGSKMKIEGTSTIHDWSMESPVLGGTIETDAKFPEDVTGAVKASVFMPVRAFKSNNKRMDEVMQEHMKEPQFKKIEYKLLDLKAKGAGAAAGPVAFDATGVLTVAGQSRTNTMPVTIEKLPGDKLKVAGSTGVKMTDYGVEPVNILLGSIKTGDDVKLSFEWVVAKKKEEKKD